MSEQLTRPPAAWQDGHGAAVGPQSVVSFGELVAARHVWWRNRDDPLRAGPARAAYGDAREAFELEHGPIVASYWCTHAESGVALTERRRRLRWLPPVYSFHRESDEVTHAWPDIACELHRCDELAVRARIVLSGVRQRICMQLVLAAASHLLGLTDGRSKHGDAAITAGAVEQERAAITKVAAYYEEAANGQAQMIYFFGMVAVAGMLTLVAAIWLAVNWASPVAALIAGAAGALVSVIQRINTGKFTLDYDVGGPYAFFLGGLRPLIGGAFAVAISFAFTGGLLHLPVAAGEAGDHRRLALLVLSFLAGFSERWAQDTLTSVLPGERSAETARPPVAEAPAATATGPGPGTH